MPSFLAAATALLFLHNPVLTSSFITAPRYPTGRRQCRSLAFQTNPTPIRKSVNFPSLHSTTSPSDTPSPATSTDFPPTYRSLDELHEELNHLAFVVENKGDISAAYRAQSIVEHLSASETDSIRPTSLSYNIVISIWSKAASRFAAGEPMDLPLNGASRDQVYTAMDCANRANSVLDALISRYANKETEIRPDIAGFNAAMDAYCKSHSIPDVENILRKMVGLTKEGQGERVGDSVEADWGACAPDQITFNIVIDAYSNNPKGMEGTLSAGEKADGVLRGMEKAGIIAGSRTFNNVINAWAKTCANTYQKPLKLMAAEKSMALLKELKSRYDESGDNEVKPDITTYTSVMDCIARSGMMDAAKIVENMLAECEVRYEETGDESVRPNVRTYTTAINAWSWSTYPKAPLKAEAILEGMEAKCDMTNFTTSSPISSQRYISCIKPNVRTYTAVLSTWARSSDVTKPQKSLKILKRMNDLYKATGDINYKPNLYTYNVVMDACAKTHAAHNPKQQSAALKIAFAVFKALKADVKANHVTYATLLKAVKNLMLEGSAERSTVVSAVFENAKKDGQVDGIVLRQLRQAAGGELFCQLVGGSMEVGKGSVDYEDIPNEWRKNLSKQAQ